MKVGDRYESEVLEHGVGSLNCRIGGHRIPTSAYGRITPSNK